MTRDAADMPLVLVHGFTGSPRSWDLVQGELRARQPERTVVVPPVPGHHPDHPVRPGFDANVDALAATIEAMLDERGLAHAPYHLAGYSLGARLALALAVRAPARLSRLTLIGGHPGLPPGPERQARAAADHDRATFLRERGLAAFIDAWEAHPIFASQAALDPARLAAQRAIRLAHDPTALAASLEHMGLAAMPDLRAPFAALPLPIDLITGQLDPKFTHLAHTLAASHPHAHATTLPACGHNPTLESPARVATLLAADASKYQR